ncbi:MAG TPA: c-type cytochrome, partial [Thermoanaerobaculia bacterium]|nr:c-type cytochrome [Thermoanaerobaculia bacterium]
ALVILAGCRPQAEQRAREMTGGEPREGRIAIARYGCGTCHKIRGVDGANGVIGPSLSNIASRSTLAGQVPNKPDNLRQWIEDPQRIAPGTTMPDMNVTSQDARDIAAYLYTLR